MIKPEKRFSLSFQKEMAHAAFIEFAAVMFVFISDLLDRISLGRQLWGPVLELAARCTLPVTEGS